MGIETNGPELWDLILDQFPPGAVIAGGAIRDFMLKVPPKDIDVFFTRQTAEKWDAQWHCPDTFDSLVHLSEEKKLEYEALGREGVIDIVHRGVIEGFTVDCVQLSWAKPTRGEEVINRFDTGIVMGWYDGTLHVTNQMLKDLANQTCTLMTLDRLDQTRIRFKRFNERMGEMYRLVEDIPEPVKSRPRKRPKTHYVLEADINLFEPVPIARVGIKP